MERIRCEVWGHGSRGAWAGVVLGAVLLCAGLPARGGEWHGHPRVDFTVGGRAAHVVRPKVAAPGKPWVWRTSFPDYHPEVDIELLQSGWHVGYVDCVDMLGADSALDIYDEFYEQVRREFGLAARPALEAVSRGGLHAYRYAARHPDRIACIYADTPVMDLKSWPLGWPDSRGQVADALRHYGLEDEAALRAFQGNPVDVLEPIARARIPLRHVISLDDQIVPPGRNTLEAVRRLEKLGHAMELVRVDRGTPESHGHHFPLPEAFASARFIMRHSTVLPGGEYFELRAGLANCRTTFENEKRGRVAFLGGSITHMSGWREAVMRYLQQRFPGTEFDFIAAGVPSLGSVPHAFRLERDVFARGAVDLLFVEAAVNDRNYDGQPHAATLALRGMEGVVRHVRAAHPGTDVVLMHFINADDPPQWGRGEAPYTIAAHEQVAERYGCPSLNLSREVSERIAAGQFTWAADFQDVHPSPYGHQLYALSITRMLDAAFASGATPAKAHGLPEPMDPRSYAKGRFGDLASARLGEGVRLDPSWTPAPGAHTRPGYVQVPALVVETAGAEFAFEFEGRGVGLMITSGPDAGSMEFSVDGADWRRVNTRTKWSGSLHLPWALMLEDELEPGAHTVRVRLVDGALRVFQFLLN